jgi:hypothetical protein
MPPVDPSAPDTVSFSSFSGLKNVVSRERLSAGELAGALNVDLDDVGQLRRRRGYTRKASGNFHSLFTADNGVVYGVKDQTLGIINPDYSFTSLGQAIAAPPTAQLAYTQVASQIYFSSPTDSGVIDQATNTVAPWGDGPDIFLSPVINPTTSLPAIRGKLIGAPPLASCLTNFNGRIYLAQGTTLWATELFLYNFVDKTRTFYQFEAPITMLGAVGDGLYVGTEEGVWFLSPTDLGAYTRREMAMKRVKVLDSPAIRGSLVYIPSELANPPQIQISADTPLSVAVLFMTANGYCAGQNSGQCYNLSESRFVFPDAAHAAAFYRNQSGLHQYVVTLDSGGQPSANARIGDYASADVIRADTWKVVDEGVTLGERWSYAFIAAGP